MASASSGVSACVEDPDIVDQAAFETAITEPLAEGDVVVAAAGDLPGQLVTDDLNLCPRPLTKRSSPAARPLPSLVTAT